MLFNLAIVVAGIALLVWSADRFVYGAAGLANAFGISPLIIGLTVVGMGTSAPEMLVSAIASLDGNPGLAFGNAVGSNIANIALVLGVTIVVMPITVSSAILKREFPAMAAVMILALLLMLDRDLSRGDGLVLVAATVILLAWATRIGLRSREPDPLTAELTAEIPTTLTAPRALGHALVGLVLLLIASRMVVWGAVNIATTLGVSDVLIGLTIVAVGTSLPELAASVASALKGQPDLALGNIIGSNMFNLLPVLAMPGLLAPGPIADEILLRDYPVMLFMTALLFAMAYGFRGNKRRINRFEGFILLAGFFGYEYLLYLTGI
ncbi:MAG: calcium/sodium antiporter [Gammaproteobacteria bacterium]|nr:calcium/sodium antiporter [Gammaproteobacteria bacterium]